jgi:O-antigen ligase
LYFGVARTREIAIAVACAAAAGVIAMGLAHYTHSMLALPEIIPSSASSQERMFSIVGGLKLFLAHPIVGAGLGAFRNQMIFMSGSQPLLIHSTAVWLLAELGLVGFLAFAVPAIYVFANEWQHARKQRVSALIVLCLVAFAIMASPADMLYQRTFWLLIGAGLAMLGSEKLTIVRD